ncbi:MAG: hypothetical protein K2N22_03475 [Clostridia bacterium]|nr:hypothetical protein [Clostridia bacterium]
MGGGGVPSGGTTIIYGKRGGLPTRGKPNSRSDLYVNEVKVQSRWYDWEGKVIRNRDYSHTDSNHTHKFPHDHDWYWMNDKPHRITEWINPDYNQYPEETK